MKKLFVIILSVFLCGTLFTSFSPSLDGRAVVAEEGSMPKGVFAKTVGYLPGDSISVTSLATKKTVDILVIGSIDSSEGVAILLSPEAAELLGLSKDLNNVVKITKRSGQLDEAVAGTAVIGGVVETPATEYDENSTIEVEPEQTESEISEENEPKSYVEEISEPESESSEESEETETAETEESFVEEIAEPEPETEKEVEPEVIETPEEETECDQDEETSVEPESVEEIAEPEPESEQEIEPEVIETPEEEPVYEKTEEGEIEPENVEEIEEDPAQEVVKEENLEEIAASEISEEKPEEHIVQDEITELEEDVPEESETVSENIPEEPEVIEAAENTEETELVEPEQLAENDELTGERIEDDNLDSLPAEKSVVALPSEEIAEDPEPETPAEENLESGKEEAVALDELDELPSKSEKIEIPAEPAVENEPELSKNEEDESFEPIVLVPTGSNPPEQTEIDSSETKNIESRTSAPTAAVSEKNRTEISSAKTSLEKYTVNSLKELERGSYYVQIAVLADEKNIEDVVAKYKDQYPVTLVPLASGNATQVMIGPLNMDEYGTVLNRFKKSGYKDAFLRKIR